MTYPSIPPLAKSWPLPPCDAIGLDPDGVSAWDLLLSAERAALSHLTPAAKYQDKLVAVRLVAWFLKDFWEYGQIIAYRRLLLEVTSCNRVAAAPGDSAELEQRHAKVFALGLDIKNHLLRVFYSRTDRTLTSSAHESQPSYDQHRAKILKSMAEDDSEGRTLAQAKEDVNGYKCVMTGYYDKVTLMKVPELNNKSVAEDVPCVETQVVHLFSESAQSVSRQAPILPIALAILQMFGLEGMAQQLLGKRVNNLWNAMTMCVHLHKDFNQLLFWLEAVPNLEHTYNVVARHPETFFRQVPKPPRTVTFRIDPEAVRDCEHNNISPHLLELPDPQLMAMRAACARVAAMSGASDQLRLITEDRDDVETLTDCDTTVYLLDSLLHTLSVDDVISRTEWQEAVIQF
ncbi:hypothetical protein B0H12DRAFT_1035521 [Mycena haematopus]|nr:hypothetical protein B0H12DRAFT_1035521 [Mycena haematopus]